MQAMTVPGNLDSLGEIREFVQAAAEEADLEGKQAYRLALAVDEIATNIVTYGYEGSQTSGDIQVSATVNDGVLAVQLSDTSPAYNPLEHSGPGDLNAPLEERKIGGLGVFLAIQNVDEFRYEYVDGENRNIFLVKHSND